MADDAPPLHWFRRLLVLLIAAVMIGASAAVLATMWKSGRVPVLLAIAACSGIFVGMALIWSDVLRPIMRNWRAS